MSRSQLTALLVLSVVVLGVLAFPAGVGAAPPVCPDGFMAMPADHHDHEGDHDHEGHLHVGLWPNADLNGDGTTCVAHRDAGSQHVHVHIDKVRRQ